MSESLDITRASLGLKAMMLHCMRPVCALCAPTGKLSQEHLGNSLKITCHLSASMAKQQSPQDNNETAFKLVLQCTYEQTTHSCKVQL